MNIILKISYLILLNFTFYYSLAHADQKISIGVVLPLTGDMAAVGAACRDAALLALEEAQPRLKNKYQIIFEDDRLIPAEVAKASQKLISIDHVSALISTWSYGGQIVAPLAERAKIPHIGIAWDNRIAKGRYNFIHLTPPSEFMRRFLDVFKALGIRRVALLGIEESGSVFALNEFIRLAPEYGVEVVFRDSVIWDMKDFNSITSKIIASKPEYLLFNLGGDQLSLPLLKSLKSLKAPFKITAITAYDVISDISQLEGSWYVSDSYLPDDFFAHFSKKYGHTIRYAIGNYYEAVRLLINAFEEQSEVDVKSVVDQLLSIRSSPSILGDTSVDSEGIFTYQAKYIRIVDGKRVQVSLDDVILSQSKNKFE